ncbi:hypothetical protein WIS52_29800 [Pseudonocardia nematodicida]|uniref:Uncharacterized protein n=1 Tax=Pseudonocardia nematodicida TaxID=1206997 RepID=A0ABV1KJP9_9PSEU
MTRPTEHEAAEALAEVQAARGAVDAATDRGLPMMLAATSVLTFLDFAAKDEITSPRRRAVVTAVTQLAMAGIALLETRAEQVRPHLAAPAPAPALAAKVAAVGVGWYATERLAVHLLRRSTLTRPNTVAGLLLAVTRPAGAVVTLRMVPRAGRDA